MKTIKIHFTDFQNSFDIHNNFIIDRIRKLYDVVLDEKEPDFVICGTFGSSFLKYNCPRILYIGEAICPDFNLYDYAIGFDQMTFGDRYLCYPLCLVDGTVMEKARKKHLRDQKEILERKRFCNYVVSAGGGFHDMRNRIYDEISKYKVIDSGGKYRNNLPDGQPVKDKEEFQKNYKFTLAPENTSFPGYVTEKIMDAWAAGTIPIYWGDPKITEYFNSDAFINIPDLSHMEEIIERIKQIDEDDALYLKMQKAPVFLPDSELERKYNEDELTGFLKKILDQNPGDAYRRNSKKTMIGTFYEYRINKWNNVEKSRWYTFLRNSKRRFFGLKKIEGV